MASQDARLSKFEADFKRQQDEMTNKIDTMLKAITDQIAGKLNLKEDANGGIGNFTGRIKGMYVFIGNFTYVVDFMIVEDIKLGSIRPPMVCHNAVLREGHSLNPIRLDDLPEGVVRFTNGDDEVTYKMPHKIEQYNLLSNLEKEHTKSVYLRNEEDKRRGVDYVMSKILGFYKECL
ncbi:hypothetical protein Tco_0730830 [Tanacetum coccineum]